MEEEKINTKTDIGHGIPKELINICFLGKTEKAESNSHMLLRQSFFIQVPFVRVLLSIIAKLQCGGILSAREQSLEQGPS